MQKALDQMNVQIHHVLNDITGVSGLKIIDAILAGERDPLALAGLCHGGVKNSEDTIAKSLEVDYRPEHIFALRRSLAAFRYYQQLILEVDRELANHLGGFETAATAAVEPPQRTKHSHCQRRRYEPKSFDLRAERYRIFGVDLTNCSRNQCRHGTNHIMRNRHGCVAVPEGETRMLPLAIKLDERLAIGCVRRPVQH
jgi:hypothetical protein